MLATLLRAARQRRYWPLLALLLPALRAPAQPTVTGTAPGRNSNSALRPTDVTLTYSQALNTATAGNVRVFSAQRGGQLVRGGNATAPTTTTIRVNPTQNFRPGETVFVTSPATVTSAGGVASQPYVYQFTAQAGAGAATFVGDLLTLSNRPVNVTAADVNNDGYLDVLASVLGGTVNVCLADGQGYYNTPTQVTVGSTNPQGIATGDVNNDGNLDLLTSNVGSSGTSGSVSVRLGNGQGGFSGTTNLPVGISPTSLTLADVDGDGRLDLLTSDTGTNLVSVRYGDGQGGFGSGPNGGTVDMGSPPRAVVAADVNGDGRLDILAASPSTSMVSISLSNSQYGYNAAYTYSVGTTPVDLAVADVDNDGNLDLLTANNSTSTAAGTVSIRLGNGQGGFFGATTVAVGINPVALLAADLNGDGNLDLATANNNNNSVNGSVSVRLGDGRGGFSGTTDVRVYATPRELTAADLDNDGDLDLLVATNGTNSVGVLYNQDLTPAVSSFAPSSGPAGTTVTLTGTNFTGATAVRFGNVNAPTFSVLSNTSLTVTVPAGVVLAPITVVTPNGPGRYVGSGNGLFASVPCTAAVQLSPAGPLTLPAGGSATLTATAVAPGFNVGGDGLDGTAQAVVVQPDGKVLVGGSFGSYNGNTAAPDNLLRLNANGTLDTSFNPGGSGASGAVQALALQPDGKIVVGGSFTSYNGTAAPDYLLRLNADGTLDTSFNPSGSGPSAAVQAVAVQPDGKIVVGGSFTSYNGAAAPDYVLRLNANGTLDTSFNPGGSGPDVLVRALAVQPDGQVLVGGGFASYNGNAAAPNGVLRLNADGSLDTGFNNSGAGVGGIVQALALQPDGKLLVGGNLTGYNGGAAPAGVLRLNADGTLDTSFNSGGSGANDLVQDLAVQADGKVLVGGNFVSYNGQATAPNYVLRLNTNGTLDASFNNGGAGADYNVSALAVQPDGRVLVGGTFVAYNGNTAAPNYLLRLNASGTLNDATTPVAGATFVFSPGGSTGNTLTVLASGGYSATATDPATGCTYTSNTVLVNAATPTVSSFSPNIGPTGTLVTLTGTNFTGATAVRFGNIDAPNFSVLSNTSLTVTVPAGVVLAPIAVVAPSGASRYVGSGSGFFGTLPCVAVAQLSPAGPLALPAGGSATLTATAFVPPFNVGGSGVGLNEKVYTLTLQPDGKILAGGTLTNYNGQLVPDRLARLNADGTVDTSFNPGGGGFTNSSSRGSGEVRGIAVQLDGKVLVGGQFISYNGQAAGQVLRLNADGTRDPSFNASGAGANDYVAALALLPDGKVIIGGAFTSYNGQAVRGMARLNTDGTLDTSFNPSGSGSNGTVLALAVQPDGRIVIGGEFDRYNGQAKGQLVRLNADGSLDASFNVGGTGFADYVRSIALQPDGKILAGGDFISYNGQPVSLTTRLNADGTLDTGFGLVLVPNPDTRRVYKVTVQPDGKILVGSDANRGQLLRLNPNGTPDASFPALTADDYVRTLVVQSDGKLVVGGDFRTFDGRTIGALVRLNADGTFHDAATPVAGATFVFSPGGATGNTLTVRAAGTYSATFTDPAIGCAYSSNAVVVTTAEPLPVTLVSFTAVAQPPGARLNWSTASERNSAYFAVERSLDGQHFAEIGRVAAAGTSGQPRHYDLLDTQPLAGVTYYRLRQVDLDGSLHYSSVRVVAGPGAAAGLQLFPVPARTTATLLGAAPGAAVQVFDTRGRLVATATADAAGTATLTLPAGLASGLYVVRAGEQTARLVVE